MLESCAIIREGAVNLSRDVTLPAHDLCICAHFSLLVFPQGPQVHAGLYTPPKDNAFWLDPGSSSGTRIELLESLRRVRFIEALRHTTHGHCCRDITLLCRSGPRALKFLSWSSVSIFSHIGMWKLPLLCLTTAF